MTNGPTSLFVSNKSFIYNAQESSTFNIEQRRLEEVIRYSFYIETFVHEATKKDIKYLENMLKLYARRQFKLGLDVVTNLTS